MYEAQTEAAIKQRMLDAVPSDLNKREGSFIYDALGPAAIELALAYIVPPEKLRAKSLSYSGNRIIILQNRRSYHPLDRIL